MTDLEQARISINKIDQEMARLFEERMKAATVIAEYKKANGLSVKDTKREEELIEKNKTYIQNKTFESYYSHFIRKVINLSCDYQTFCMSGLKVAYSGVEGAFAHIAAKQMFPSAKLISYPDFKSAYKSAESGECDCAVLPFENSFAGEVGPVMDLSFNGNLFINQVLNVAVVQNLLGIKGTDISKIKKVVSHPQALEQCADFIQKHGFEAEPFSNTAAAAKYIKELNDPSVAAIASDETAKIFDLNLLESRINTSTSNTTRFGAFTPVKNIPSASKNPEDVRFILMFTVKNEAGSLTRPLNIIGENGFNLVSLRSRPMKNLNWNYYFYVEVEGSPASENGKKMLAELETVCQKLKILGSFFTSK